MKTYAKLRRPLMLMLAVCMIIALMQGVGGILTYAVPEEPGVVSASAGTDWDEIQSIISRYYGQWNDSSYTGLTSNTIPSTALMGNGDLGVTSGGSVGTKTYHISKSDFWTFLGSPLPIGGLTIRSTSPIEEPDPQKTSLALNKPAWGNNENNGAATRALSGTWTSGYEGWVTANRPIAQDAADPRIMYVDLQDPTTFNRFVIRHDGGRSNGSPNFTTRGYKLEYSTDPNGTTGTTAQRWDSGTWTEFYSISNNTAAFNDIILDAPITALRIKLTVTRSTQGTDGSSNDQSANSRARIHQFELYNEANLTANVTPTGSGTTRTFDLGSTNKISRFRITGAANSGNSIRLEASNNNVNWYETVNLTNRAGPVIDLTVNAFNARYVRVTATQGAQNLELYTRPCLDTTKIVTGGSQPPGPLHEIEDILNAEVRTDLGFADGEDVSIKTWTSATENIIISEITSRADQAFDMEVQVWGKNDVSSRPATASNTSNTITATRMTASNQTSVSGSYRSRAAISARLIGAGIKTISSNNSEAKSTMTFELPVGATVYVVTAVGGGGRNYATNGTTLNTGYTEPVAQAASLLDKIAGKSDVDALAAAHKAWWKDYWMQSYIKLDASDEDLDTIMKYYYAAQYMLGCCAREGNIAPGLYGHWHTTDDPMWSSDYHLNYNFIATWYGAAGSNHASTMLPVFEAMYAYKPEAMRRAGITEELRNIAMRSSTVYYVDRHGNDWFPQKIASGQIHPTNGIPGAILYPVGTLPWGMSNQNINQAPSYHGQLLDALFNLMPMTDYYEYTRDSAVLPDLYDYIKRGILLYEAWIDWDVERGEYLLYAAYNEGSWSINPAVELAVFKNALKYAIKYSEILGVDAQRRAEWIDMLSKLPAQPTSPYQNKPEIYALAELAYNVNTRTYSPMSSPIPSDGNILPMETVIPMEVMGHFSSQRELKIAQDTVDVFGGAWGNNNNFPKIFPVAANVRYSPEIITARLASVIRDLMAPNMMIKDPYHGVEKIGATRAVNNMLLLSHEGVMAVFPNWLKDKDAKFVNLRERGAFLVSSEYDSRARNVKYITIESEAGLPVTIASPWKRGVVVTDQYGVEIPAVVGTAPNHPDEITYKFDTTAGMTYTLTEGKGLLAAGYFVADDVLEVVIDDTRGYDYYNVYEKDGENYIPKATSARSVIYVENAAETKQYYVAAVDGDAESEKILVEIIKPVIISNVFLNKPVTTTPPPLSGFSASNIVDGLENSRFAANDAGSNGRAVVEIDIKGEYSLTQLRILMFAANNGSNSRSQETKFEVYTEDGGWQTVFENVALLPAPTWNVFDYETSYPCASRARFTFQNRIDGGCPSIYEIQATSTSEQGARVNKLALFNALRDSDIFDGLGIIMDAADELAYVGAKEAAAAGLVDQTISQAQSDELAEALNGIMRNEIDRIKQALTDLIAQAEAMDPAMYINWAGVATALANAKLIDESSETGAIVDAYYALQTALDALLYLRLGPGQPAAISVRRGGTTKITIDTNCAGVTFTSAVPVFATVGPDGTVTGVMAGITVIRITDPSSGASINVAVNVIN